MERVHKLKGYSSYPYTATPENSLERRAQKFFYSFKNGRSYHWPGPPLKHLSFEELLVSVANSAITSPPFREPEQLLLVPVPRSGNSRKSFGPHAHKWPNLALAQALAENRAHLRVELLLKRRTPVRCASDSTRRTTVQEHLGSLKVLIPPELRDARIVLIDDLITRGTQAMACMVALQEQGLRGPIVGYFVSQTIGPKAATKDRKKHLVHKLTWQSGADYPRRVELGSWKKPD